MKRVSVRGTLSAATMQNVLREVTSSEGRPLAAVFEIDLSGLSFIDAGGIVIFTNLLEWLKRRPVRAQLVGYQGYGQAIRYLDDCGFFKHHLGHPLKEFASLRETTLPVTTVAHAQSHGWLEFTAMPWLASKLQMSTASLSDLSVSLKELFNNIVDHSTEQIACIHVQWHPKQNQIRVAVSDFGVGIAREVQRLHPHLNDPEAIFWASEEGFSTKPGGRNLGAGLAILIDNVVERNGGEVQIYANRGSLLCKGGQRITAETRAFYPGTLVNITLRTDTIELVPEREDLQW
jgi:anti-sigma regulatory factor (Ser/Thr protein kinase)/anti-anti-sigma regulatory factor